MSDTSSYMASMISVRENVTTQKNVKSHVFLFWKKRKKRKKRTYSFTGHLITPGLNTQLPEVSTGKSPTSNILLRNADTRNCAT